MLATIASGVRLRRMAIKDGLLAEFDHEMGTTRRLLERLPDDKLSWKPHDRSMSMGGLATHLANLPNWGGNILNEPFFDLAGAPPNLHGQEPHAPKFSTRSTRRSGRRVRGSTRATPSCWRRGR